MAGHLPMLPPPPSPTPSWSSGLHRTQTWVVPAKKEKPFETPFPPNILKLFPDVKRIVLLQMAVEMEKEMRDISANRSSQAVESISIHILYLQKFNFLFYFRKFWCTIAPAVAAGQVESAPGQSCKM